MTFLDVVWERVLSGSSQLKWSLIYCANMGRDAQPVMQNGNNSSHDLFCVFLFFVLSALHAYPPQLIPAGRKSNDCVCHGNEQLGVPSKFEMCMAPNISKIAYLKPAQVWSNMLHWHNFQDRHSFAFSAICVQVNEKQQKYSPFPTSS